MEGRFSFSTRDALPSRCLSKVSLAARKTVSGKRRVFAGRRSRGRGTLRSIPYFRFEFSKCYFIVRMTCHLRGTNTSIEDKAK